MASKHSEKPMHALPHLSLVLPRLPSKQCQCLSCRIEIVPDLGGWNVDCFLSPLLFPLGDQCCDALACPFSESSSSLGAPLACLAANQMWCLMCLPVYLPVHSHWLRHKSLQPITVHGCVPARAAHSRLHLLQEVHWVYENDGMCNLCVMLAG